MMVPVWGKTTAAGTILFPVLELEADAGVGLVEASVIIVMISAEVVVLGGLLVTAVVASFINVVAVPFVTAKSGLLAIAAVLVSVDVASLVASINTSEEAVVSSGAAVVANMLCHIWPALGGPIEAIFSNELTSVLDALVVDTVKAFSFTGCTPETLLTCLIGTLVITD